MAQEIGDILAGVKPEQEAETHTETVEPSAPAETDAQPRDDAGRFATKAPPAEPESEAERAPAEERPKGGFVPQPALHAERQRSKAERERADELERQLVELRGQVTVLTQQRPPEPAKEPEKPVSVWDNPDAWASKLIEPVQQQLAETTFLYSQRAAVSEHGAELVNTAGAALKAAMQSGSEDVQAWSAKLRASRDPVGDVMRWHQSQPATREAQLREQIRAELEAEYQARQPAPSPAEQPPASPQVMPSNLVGERNVGARSGPAWSGPAPLNDIFDRSRKKAG
jgi:hypothetical protein